MDVVEIPSKGIVYRVEGRADIKKARSAEYSDIVIDMLVESDDILWLKKGSIVGIKFDDNSFVLNEPQDKDTFITFKFIEPQAQ